MRLSDTAAGLLVLVLGLAVAGYARTFPPMPGQDIGPSFFPTAIGLGLAAFGAALALAARRHRAGAPLVTLDLWVRRRDTVRRAALVVIGVALYVALADVLGFFPAGIVFLIALWRAFGARGRWMAPAALALVLAVHYSFYTVLGVPLPWGLLEPFAW